MKNRTIPKNPFTTRFPRFPSIRDRLAPHPLDDNSWKLDIQNLTLPPPPHLLTLDNGNSIFDVNFARSGGGDRYEGIKFNDIGGLTIHTLDEKNCKVCFTGWQCPAPSPGEPFVYLSRVCWGTLNAEAMIEKGRPFSMFFGSGSSHQWRYRGEVEVFQHAEISPETFAQMGSEEKTQWIDYFRLENVFSRTSIDEAEQTPNEFFTKLSSPREELPREKLPGDGLRISILRVVGYDEERINTWLTARNERVRQMAERDSRSIEVKGNRANRRSGASCQSQCLAACIAYFSGYSSSGTRSGG